MQLRLAAFTFFAFLLIAQDSTRLLRFTATEDPRSQQEIATVIRSIADISQLAADPADRALSVTASAPRIALAEWLFTELDRPSDSTPREYRIDPSGEEIVRVAYLNHSPAPRDLQEVAAIVRSLIEIPRVFTCNAPRALIVRGPSSRIALAGWLIAELDRPAESIPTSPREYRSPAPPDEVTRVFYLPASATPQDLQEAATILRSITGIRRVFTYQLTKAITLRGAPNEVAMAEWLMTELHNPTGRQYPLPAATDDFTRVFLLAGTTSPQQLQETAASIRVTSGAGRVVTYNSRRAIVVRGTSSQLTAAENILPRSR